MSDDQTPDATQPGYGDGPVPLPALPGGWMARTPELADVPALADLRARDIAAGTGSGLPDEAMVESEVAGPASWTRQQVVVEDAEGVLRGWLIVHDRAAGRALVWGYFDRDVSAGGRAEAAADGVNDGDDVVAAVAAEVYAWAEQQAVAMAQLRGIDSTRLDASPFQGDDAQRGWLAAAGYAHRRTWLHMTRPVSPDEDVPPLREGVSIRGVEKHENGQPVAADLQHVHRVLEESFADHFNNYRESFPEFVQRLREDPGHRWDHWWIAEVTPESDLPSDEPETEHVPAGATVCSVLSPDSDGVEGSYVEYIGVNRNARGRGVAKGMLHAVIADARDRGRNRVGLEVDADSPTKADELYRSLGWETDYVTESWFKDLSW